MEKFEKILIIAVVIALIMKLASIPGGAILATLSLLILACFYYLFSFAFFNKIKLKSIFSKKSYEGISGWRIIGSIAAGIGLLNICVGILFKIQHWPGSMTILLIGLIITIFIELIVVIKLVKSKSDFYRSILLRALVFSGLGLLLYFMPDVF